LRLPLDPISEPRQNPDMIGHLSSGISNSSGPISQQHLLHQQSVSSFPERTFTSPSLPGSKTLPGGTASISPTPYGRVGGGTDMSGQRIETPLQKHLAYLARYGITGVSSGPNDRQNVGGSDEHSVNSLRESSLLNGAAAGNSGVSIAQSGSVRSLRNTLKKFSTLNLGRTSKET